MLNAFVALVAVTLCLLPSMNYFASSALARAPSTLTINCSDVISKAGPGATPKVNGLISAARTNDIDSVCLLLKAGKDVNKFE